MSLQKNEGFVSSESKDSFYDTSEDAEFSLASDRSSKVTPEELPKLIEEWKNELKQTEDEISTLRQVLSSKLRKQNELRRKLGITVWQEFKDDMEQGIKTIQETTAYQKTSQTLKSASEKTSEALKPVGATVTKKLEEIKQSSTFKSIEEKFGSVYSSVKGKVSGSFDATGSNTDPLIAKPNGSSEKH